MRVVLLAIVAIALLLAGTAGADVCWITGTAGYQQPSPDGTCPLGTFAYGGPICWDGDALAMAWDGDGPRCLTAEELRVPACETAVTRMRAALAAAYEADRDYDQAALREYLAGRPCAAVLAGYQAGVGTMADWADAEETRVLALPAAADCRGYQPAIPALPSVGVCE
jgi:hypothetical protein